MSDAATLNQRQLAIQSRKNAESERVDYALWYMAENKAYRYAAERAGGDPDGRLLQEFRDRYQAYRQGWRGQPREAMARNLTGAAFAASGMQPLCVDIEVAAVCDLACPFCFRQYIVTPDKIISEDLYARLIEECGRLGVPSVKLNWRGEPLMHPKIARFVDMAKRAGVIEVLVNTNATRLDEKMARSLIEAGLDQIIYSFDGGSKESYEKMRVGRFSENRFEDVYANIRRFAEVRREMGAVWPRTKIQMILTDDTFREQDSFFALFDDCVDDVSVKAYTERGGFIPDLDDATRAEIGPVLDEHGVGHNAAYWRDINGNLYVSKGRLPCEQPYQRLMVTYDGRVSMCCYDWGSEHPVGYVDEAAFARGENDFKAVQKSIKDGKRGFAEFMGEARMPRRHIEPPKVVQSLRDIWTGALIDDVREQHACGKVEDVKICKRCPFKETYDWVRIKSPAGATA